MEQPSIKGYASSLSDVAENHLSGRKLEAPGETDDLSATFADLRTYFPHEGSRSDFRLGFAGYFSIN